ncbi:MAG TPA: YdeI/OmpD-associated family protein [Paracoccaceae bacterium]|nr:YdeI/OmpD-associated family protein [Paracoccaceae bacterium]
MARAAEDAPILTVRSRADLRDWLAAHHTGPGPVWLASYKRHHPDYLPYEPQVEELLCWGWIDSLTRALDADRSMILIAPRNPKSAWSALNKAHVERAIASGAMTPAGLAKVEAAKTGGQWDFLNDVEALIDPPDLPALIAAAGAADFWATQPRSIRRGALEWIKTARTAPTRTARIADVAGSAAQGLRPSPFRRSG